MTLVTVDDKGDVLFNNNIIGKISGLRFFETKSKEKQIPSPQSTAISDEISKEIAQLLEHKGERLLGAPNNEIILSIDGFLRWRGEIIAELIKGENIYTPKTLLLGDNNISKDTLSKINDRLTLWLRHHINSQLELILALQYPSEIEGDALKLCKILFENFGLISRQQVAEIVKGLDQDIRAKLRRFGIKFGAYHVYLPLTLKPAPRELLLILWALQNDSAKQEGLAELPHIILTGRTSFEIDKSTNKNLYEIAGFKVAGNRAVRIDILERLADIIRPLITLNPDNIEGELPDGAAPKNGFRTTVEMTSLLGCSGSDFSSILTSLGYRVERTKIEEIIPQENNKQEPATIKDNSQTPKEVESEASEIAELEEPKYDEIFYPNYYRNEQSKQKFSKNIKSKQHKAKTKHKENTQKHHKYTAKKQKPIDPDSPFAALLALKTNKK